jgi:hypothetical protein
MMETQKIDFAQLIEGAMRYESYLQLIQRLLAEGKTTGPNQSEELTFYTQLNLKRMQRLDKTIKLTAELEEAIHNWKTPIVWLVITEAWCGDAAQNIPFLNKIAEANPQISLALVLRDEHPALMDAYLTNGTRSIPKLVCLSADNYHEIGTWGPRPQTAQALIMDLKKELNLSKEEYIERVHAWYAKDKTMSMQNEFVHLLNNWNLS